MISLFLKQPFEAWDVVHGYGLVEVENKNYNNVLLQTTSDGIFYAAMSGVLSVRPSNEQCYIEEEGIEVPDITTPLPETINLYLHIFPNKRVSFLLFHELNKLVNNVESFLYENVEVLSLVDTLREKIDEVTISQNIFSHEGIIKLFLQGALDIPIEVGEPIGKAAKVEYGGSERQLSFSIINKKGPVGVSYFYNIMRILIDDRTDDIEDFLSHSFILDYPGVDGQAKEVVMESTLTTIYNYNILKEIKKLFDLSYDEWRLIGNRQKMLYLEQLRRRSGLLDDNTIPYFEFEELDWKNIFQIEAIVQFYINFNDPWKNGSEEESGGNYKVIDFLDPEGSSATVTGKQVTINNADSLWTQIMHESKNGEIIKLENANPKYYRIAGAQFNNTDRTLILTLKKTPSGLPSGNPITAWKIYLHPNLVIIDPFKIRARGIKASLLGMASNETQIKIEDNIDLDEIKINKNFDTIFLEGDTNRISKTYRIKDYSSDNMSITVYGSPNIDDDSGWRIPAGLGGHTPQWLDYNTRYFDATNYGNGYDHYEGMCFVLARSEVYLRETITSFTSREWGQGEPPPLNGKQRDAPNSPDQNSSIKGNAIYYFYSHRSGQSKTRNYTLKLIDKEVSNGASADYDSIVKARRYFNYNVESDNKGRIRIHNGWNDESGNRFHKEHRRTGSAGCLVSPRYYKIRSMLIKIYQENYKRLNNNGDLDLQVNKLYNKSRGKARRIWQNTDDKVSGKLKLPARRWINKLKGKLWLIRPQERPVGPPNQGGR